MASPRDAPILTEDESLSGEKSLAESLEDQDFLFNACLREECLRVSWFQKLFDARRKIAIWRKEYNQERQHSSLDYRTPKEFAAQAAMSFVITGVGHGASNAGPLPHVPHPRSKRGWC